MPAFSLIEEVQQEHAFPVRWRGYDRRQVESLVARIWITVGQAESIPGLDRPVTRDELTGLGLYVVLGGYDMPAVDQALSEYRLMIT
jgi:hypothetical protein